MSMTNAEQQKEAQHQQVIFTKNEDAAIRSSNIVKSSSNQHNDQDRQHDDDDEANDYNDYIYRDNNKNISVHSFESMKVPDSNAVHGYDGEHQQQQEEEDHSNKIKVEDEEQWIPQQLQQAEQKEKVGVTIAETRPSLQHEHKHRFMNNVRKNSKYKIKKAKKHVKGWLMLTSDLWLPSPIEVIEIPTTPRNKDNLQSSSNMLSSSNSMTSSSSQEYMIVEHQRSIRQRIHLILTEPESSKVSAIVFVIIVICVILMNTMMILQTMDSFQYTPLSCHSCNIDSNNIDKDHTINNRNMITDILNDDVTVIEPTPDGVQCICPPLPYQWTHDIVGYMIFFFTGEVSFRILTYTPPYNIHHHNIYYHWISHYISFLMTSSVIFDALAVYPYYIPAIVNSQGLLPLILLRMFRVFYLVRLGKYNQTYQSFMNVLRKSYDYLRILIMILLFGALIFGSLLYYLEQGYWGYYEPLGTYTFLRNTTNNEPEPTPFISIPVSFWWFIVTATTVGYGDMVPTSILGRFVASWAMIMGVLVIAFPVGVFTDLWSAELKRMGTIRDALADDDNSDDKNDDHDDVDGTIIQNKNSIHDSKQEATYIDPTNHDVHVTNNTNNGYIDVPPVRSEDEQNDASMFNRHRLHASLFNSNATSTSHWDINNSINTDHNIDSHNNVVHEDANRMIHEMLDDNYVAIHKDDLLDLMYHLQLIYQSNVQIRQSNHHIRMGLKKYKRQIQNSNHNDMP